jgi:Domain of unknown function (DUF1918)
MERGRGGDTMLATEGGSCMATAQHEQVEAGNLVEVTGHRVGESRRSGEVLEVLGEPGHRHYRVRWEDGSETILYPSGDVSIRPARKRAGKRA